MLIYRKVLTILAKKISGNFDGLNYVYGWVAHAERTIKNIQFQPLLLLSQLQLRLPPQQQLHWPESRDPPTHPSMHVVSQIV